MGNCLTTKAPKRTGKPTERRRSRTGQLTFPVLFLALAACGPGSTPPHTSRLCSWNLRKLGQTEGTNHELVAAIVDSHCDAVALQEVMDSGGSAPGYDALLIALGREWSGTRTAGSMPKGAAGAAEYYAFVWRTRQWRPCGATLAFDPSAGSTPGVNIFVRPPAFLCLAAAASGPQLAVLMGSYHAPWNDGDKSGASEEAFHLAQVVEEVEAGSGAPALLFGDFNLQSSELATSTTLHDRTTGLGSTLSPDGSRTNHLYDHLLVRSEPTWPQISELAQPLDVRFWAGSPEDFLRQASDHLPLRATIAW
jgi:endonuclease/exonuclease/phosphatase family metal-dependent hydrolase